MRQCCGANLIQPVLKSQPGHLPEILRVAGEQQGIVLQGNAGDAEIMRRRAQPLRAQPTQSARSISIPRKHHPFGEELHALLKPLIRDDFCGRSRRPVDLRQPAAQALLHIHHRRGHRLPALAEAMQQPRTRRRGFSEHRKMI